MEIRKVLALRGPNIWANYAVLEAWVDLGALKDAPSDELPGFNERLMAWLPSMIEHRCSVGTRGGFFERLRRGTYQAHILEHVVLELQTLAGTEVGFGRTRETSEEGVYKVAFEYEYEDLGRAALEVARDLCLAAVHNRPFDMENALAQLRELAQRLAPPPAVAAIVRAARKRKIPVAELGDEGLLRLGHGARQRRVRGAQTDRTSALAESIADDAELTRTLLHATGVPVAEERPAGIEHRLLVVAGAVAAATRRDTGADVTGQVHPEVAARVVDAAAIIGLDVAGIDVVTHDISLPLEEQGGAVIAVHARPDLALHLPPVGAASRAAPTVGDAIVSALFPEGETGRIPIVGVTGVNGKTTTTRLIAHMIGLTQGGAPPRVVGMTCTEGVYIGGRRIEAGDCSGPQSARLVLDNPRVEAAVLETARGGILRAGLGFDRCDVAVVTNIAEGDHLGVADIDTPEQLARVKRTLVEAVARGGAAVLNAEDPLVAGMADVCRGSVVFFAEDGRHPIVEKHRAGGGRAVVAHDNQVVLTDGDQAIPLLSLERVPLTHGGRIGFQVQNVLAATAAAWSLGIPCEAIRVALETFCGDLDKVPGRFNLLEINGATVVVDYGHNVPALTRVIQAVEQLPHRRRTAVYSTAGDRRDCDMVRQGELLGDAFDRVILYEDHYLRGRKKGEIMGLFRQGLASGTRVDEILEIHGAVNSVETALSLAEPGELLLIQADEIDETVELLKKYLAVGAGRRQIDFQTALEAAEQDRTPKKMAVSATRYVGGQV